jgi:two-component system, cell cycle response regulator DivK
MEQPSTILYIEDNFENRILVKRILQANGFQILEAENAQQAIEHLRESLPDLILMDINLPEIDGYTLTQRLKSIPFLQPIPIIALTANVMKGDRERTLEAGCDGYIEKPIDVDKFIDQIHTFLMRQS